MFFTDDILPYGESRPDCAGKKAPNGLGKKIIILYLKNHAGLLNGAHSEYIHIKKLQAVKARMQSYVERNADVTHGMNIGLSILVYNYVGP